MMLYTALFGYVTGVLLVLFANINTTKNWLSWWVYQALPLILGLGWLVVSTLLILLDNGVKLM
jgi:uncharacterized integral membrane protein